MDAWLKTQAASYATSGAAAGKLALAAVAAGSNPRSYGGVDLVAVITGAAGADGSLSAWGPDAFGQSLGVLALARSGTAVPTLVAANLRGLQGVDGSFGYADWSTGAYVADPDTTALALMALAALAGTDPAAKAAAVKARDWLITHRTAAGYWTSYSPANTAGYAGVALLLVGSTVTTSATWLATQQQADGGLPATLDGSPSDLYATLQGMLLFAGESLLSVGPGGLDRVSLAAASPSASASSSVSPSSSVSVSTSASSSTVPSSTAPSVSHAPSVSVSSSITASASASAPATSASASVPGSVSSAPSSSTVTAGPSLPAPALSVSATTVRQGRTVTVTGTGFTSQVRGTVHSAPMDLGTQIPDSSGTVRFTFSTAALEPGVHTVVLTSGETSVRATFTVVSAAATLPATGSDIPPAALAAAVLALLVGIGLVVRGRFVR